MISYQIYKVLNIYIANMIKNNKCTILKSNTEPLDLKSDALPIQPS